MIKEHFSLPTKTEWIQLLERELKGESIAKLMKFNRIEEINLPSYFHSDDLTSVPSDPGIFPYTRGFNAQRASWEHGTCFRIADITSTKNEIIQALNAGTTSLHLHATTDEEIDFEHLMEGVQLEYIFTHFYPNTKNQAIAFQQFIANNPSAIHGTILSDESTSKNSIGISGYSVHLAGGTTWQEIAISLAEGHEELIKGIKNGLSVEASAERIHFQLGIGTTFFYEIAKIRAFRELWSLIVKSYDDKINVNTLISARTGLTQYSAKDPYTNLLRQTTQAMSALLGGVSDLVIEPYDWYTTVKNTSFTRRMATNISLLLQEEAQFGVIVDAMGGSYVLEVLTQSISERAWSEFQRIEQMSGITSEGVKTTLLQEIKEKAEQRISSCQSGTTLLIGINKYAPTTDNGVEWETLPIAWNGLQTLQLEHACQQ